MDGYAKQFEQKLGYTPYPGTLNVVLDPESVTRRTRLDSIESIRIEGWSDGNRHYGGASCYPIRLSLERRDDAAHLAIPDRTDHDESKLELLAPNRLRDAGLNDGDRIVVTLMPPTATTTSGGGSNTEY